MSPDLALGLILWTGGMIGVVAIVRVVPQIAAQAATKKKLPPAILIAVALAQSAVLLALAVWCGVALSPVTALHAPIVEGIVGGLDASRAPILISGCGGAVVGGLLLLGAAAYVRHTLPPPKMKFEPPLSARLLYGGITEELLLRWGVMSLFAWLGARMLHAPQTPSAAMWLAIGASAFLFAIGHLPAARAIFGGLTVKVTSYVIVANTAFGVMAGWLFWRYGIESAIVAHAGAHAIAAAFGKRGNAWSGDT